MTHAKTEAMLLTLKLADRNLAVPAIARAAGVSVGSVRNWLTRLRPGYIEGHGARHLRRAQALGYPTVQAAVVALSEAGQTQSEVGAALGGMCTNTVGKYLAQEAAVRPLRRPRRRGLHVEVKE